MLKTYELTATVDTAAYSGNRDYIDNNTFSGAVYTQDHAYIGPMYGYMRYTGYIFDQAKLSELRSKVQGGASKVSVTLDIYVQEYNKFLDVASGLYQIAFKADNSTGAGSNGRINGRVDDIYAISKERISVSGQDRYVRLHLTNYALPKFGYVVGFLWYDILQGSSILMANTSALSYRAVLTVTLDERGGSMNINGSWVDADVWVNDNGVWKKPTNVWKSS